MNAPSQVHTFDNMAVQKIVCGPTYSAAITGTGRLMVTGSLEHGKLGLGSKMIGDVIKHFTMLQLR